MSYRKLLTLAGRNLPAFFNFTGSRFNDAPTGSRFPCTLLWVVLLAAAPSAAGQDAHEHVGDALGAVHFDVSCSPEVSDAFDRSVALLHHMQYDEARAAFKDIAETDAGCGMAHWGIAMTLFQPLWPSRPDVETLKRGSDEVRKARETGNLTDREVDLVAAAEAFFRDPESTDWWTRIRRWSEAMSRAHEARPDDIETSAFYALSQLAAGQIADNRMDYHGRAAKVLLSIYDSEPTHPGAIHYTIHANDVDARAGESIEIVRSYSGIAPEVPHALHMPTHIFVRLGAWPDVIEWNRRSADAALRLPVGEAVSHHYPHAADYLVYAYLQRGEDAKALAILEEVTERDQPFQGTFVSAFHLASMPARYAVERRMWEEARAIEPRTPASLAWDRFWWAESISWFARGLGALHTGDTEQAERALARMADLRDAASKAGEEAFAEYIEVDRLVLAAWQAHVAGKEEKALELVGEAVRLEGTTQKHPVTPGALYPSQEALGDLLMEMGRSRDALAAYEGSLAVWPGRFNSLTGAARAARAAGLEEEAQKYYRTLLEVSATSESDRQAITEARDFLGA